MIRPDDLESMLRRIVQDELSNIQPKLRDVVRKELRDAQDRNSFASAGGWLTMAEVQEYTGYSRDTIYRYRLKRKRATTPDAKEAAFPASYNDSGKMRFRKSDIDAWLEARKSD